MTASLANGHMLPNLLQGGKRAVWSERASQWHGGANYNPASQAQDVTSDRLLRRKSKSRAKEWTKLEHRVLIPKGGYVVHSCGCAWSHRLHFR
jgi:hypothetical protein